MNETQKIRTTINEFADEMKAKMLKKKASGWEGWDDSKSESRIENGLKLASIRQFNAGDQEIDIANYAMMLWNLKRCH